MAHIIQLVGCFFNGVSPFLPQGSVSFQPKVGREFAATSVLIGSAIHLVGSLEVLQAARQWICKITLRFWLCIPVTRSTIRPVERV